MVTLVQQPPEAAPITTPSVVGTKEEIQQETEMTLEQFLKHFAKAARGFHWTIRSGRLRGYSNFITAALPLGKIQCPNTAVAWELTGQRHPIKREIHAGVASGLSYRDARRIADASDNLPGCDKMLQARLYAMAGVR